MNDYETILTKLGDISTSQARTEEKQKATHEIVVKLEEKVGTQNGRIGKLERWQSRIFGALGVIGVIGGVLWKLF